MGFLKNLFAAEQADIHAEWKTLNDINQLDELVNSSSSKPVVIFKHSIRCGTSAMVKHQLEEEWDFEPEELDFYYLDLINYRNISDKVAEMFGVVHQSPQVILLKNGVAAYSTSHTMISTASIRSAIER